MFINDKHDYIARHFDAIGARIVLNEYSKEDFWNIHRLRERKPDTYVRLDISNDKKGSLFMVEYGEMVNLMIIDALPKMRHLLLMAKTKDEKHKFLCGHDEKDWFVAAIPEKKNATTVYSAMESLKPKLVLDQQDIRHIKTKDKTRRKTAAYIRQGEWFFIPAPDLVVKDFFILYNEPLQRGRSKPHVAQELVRTGGETVYVSRKYPAGITQRQFDELKRKSKDKAMLNGEFRVMRRNPSVFVRGSIRHPDHRTIYLDYWHRVCPNTENESIAMQNVAFLD